MWDILHPSKTKPGCGTWMLKYGDPRKCGMFGTALAINLLHWPLINRVVNNTSQRTFNTITNTFLPVRIL